MYKILLMVRGRSAKVLLVGVCLLITFNSIFTNLAAMAVVAANTLGEVMANIFSGGAVGGGLGLPGLVNLDAADWSGGLACEEDMGVIVPSSGVPFYLPMWCYMQMASCQKKHGVSLLIEGTV
jgi:hypothetical protein